VNERTEVTLLALDASAMSLNYTLAAKLQAIGEIAQSFLGQNVFVP
jgi:hypothetical protein